MPARLNLNEGNSAAIAIGTPSASRCNLAPRQSPTGVQRSLGGLVIKSGMTHAQALGDPLRLALLDRIAGVVFVGTPHQGSSLATVAHKLRLLLRTNAQVTNKRTDKAVERRRHTAQQKLRRDE